MTEQFDSESSSSGTGRPTSDSDAKPSPVPEEVLELDSVYDVLAHPRRRYLCYGLLSESERSLTDLARKIAAWEDDVPESAVSDDRRDRVYLALYHTHVPKLVEKGVVSFDSDDGTISTAENARQVLSVLEGVGASLDSAQESHARDDESR